MFSTNPVRPLGIFLLIVVLSLGLQPDQAAAKAQIAEDDVIGATLDQAGIATVSAMFLPATGSIDRDRHAVTATLPTTVQVLGQLASVPALTLRVQSRADLDALRNNPLIVSLVLPPERAEFAAARLNFQATSTLDAARRAIGADQFHAAGIQGSGQVIAVVDSGVDASHPDIGAGVVFERCAIAFSSQTCPNGTALQVGPGAAFDDDGHGTNVIGMITGDGMVAGRGIAPEAHIEVYKVGGAAGLDLNDVLATLDFIAVHRPAVGIVNLSIASDAVFSGPCDRAIWPEFFDVVAQLRSRGVLVVAAAGNQSQTGLTSFPACLAPVISVAATTSSPALLASSNIDASTDVTAPGSQIITAAVGGGTETSTGSSFAVPIVSSCIALVRQEGITDPNAIEARISSSLLRSERGGFSSPWVACAPLCAGVTPTVNLAAGQLPTGGDDVILGTANADTIDGLAGNDIICGLDGDDIIVGGSGDDTIHAGRGDDQIFAGPGNDTANGQLGDDLVHGGPGDDYLYGSWGHDEMHGDGGNDTIHGKAGRDEIYGGDGDDNINAGSGSDSVFGGLGDDLINLGTGSDTALGGEGRDVIAGQGGSDTIYGRDGDDRMWGQYGTDTLLGGAGNDFLSGGLGEDECAGDGGADVASSCEWTTGFP